MSELKAETFDVIVIGAGAAGEVLAGRTASSGLRTAIIERELVGGECSYWACIPSKVLLKPESVLAAARRIPGASTAVAGNLDVEAVFRTRDDAVNRFDDASQVKWVESSGIALYRGTARLDGERRVLVTTETGEHALTASNAVVIAAGSRPAIPPIPGLEEIDVWTSRNATTSSFVPRRLAVIGGGTVAVEMAQAWNSLGSEQVTVLVRGDRLLEREEPFASAALLKAFDEVGIDVRIATSVVSARRLDDGSVELILNDDGTVVADNVLVATGRLPNTDDVGVETVGLVPGKPIEVDDKLRAKAVSGDWLYAVGDVNGRALLTHMGKYQSRVASDIIAGKLIAGRQGEDWSDNHAVPGVTFTEPQIASVGLRAAAARKKYSVREVQVPWTSTAGATLSGITEGIAHIVIDEDRHVIVGATFVGPESGEMLHAATIAIAGEVTLERLWHAVPAFPTISEFWLRLLEE